MIVGRGLGGSSRHRRCPPIGCRYLSGPRSRGPAVEEEVPAGVEGVQGPAAPRPATLPRRRGGDGHDRRRVDGCSSSGSTVGEAEGPAMKAAVVTSFSEPLEILERRCPEPGVGQVLIRLEACGLCHTDIHAARGEWPVKPTLPFVPGHEGIGIIEKLGAGVTNRTAGERVSIAWLGSACGECRYCVDGRETLCEKQQNSGYSIDGAFAEYAVASCHVRRPRARRCQLDRCRAPELRRRDDLQGPQGRPGPTHRAGRGVRHRRPGPSRGPVRPAHGRHRGGHRHRAAQARARREPRCRAPRERLRRRPGGLDPGARRTRRRRGAGCVPDRLRAGLRAHFVAAVASCAWGCPRTAAP